MAKTKDLTHRATSLELERKIHKILEKIVPAPLQDKLLTEKNIDKFFVLLLPYQREILSLNYRLHFLRRWNKFSFMIGYLVGFFVFNIPGILDNIYKFKGEWTVPLIAGGLFIVLYLPYQLLDNFLWKRSKES